MFDPQVLAFIGVAALLTIIPGADTMLVLRSVLAHGRRAGILTTFGIVSGLLVHATLSALGLSLILVRSAQVFHLVKLAGAAYLIFLGLGSIWALIRHGNDVANDEAPPGEAFPEGPTGSRPEVWRSFVEGLLNNLLNPKVAIFYLAFLPQFISPGDPVLAKSILLAFLHLLMGIVWLSLVAVSVERMRGLLIRPLNRRRLEAVAGVILIGLGLRLALERE
jgi:threonine/homoserine/homoserine lactone efflux protein